MEAFEKWKRSFYRENDPLPTPSAEESWRAFGEWLLSKNGPLDERVQNCDYVRAKIRQELEETDATTTNTT
jgi:hypothetical protein